MQQLSDEDIIRMVLQGNTKAFAMLVERYSSYVYTLALQLLPSSPDAEEAAQDVFVKAYRSLDSFNGKAKFSTWLYTITRNTCLSRTRTGAKAVIFKEEHQLANIAGQANNIVTSQEDKARKNLVAASLKHLHEEEAEMITLFYIHEQSIDEICTILNISNSNAKVKLFRARKRLREILDKHFSNELKEYH